MTVSRVRRVICRMIAVLVILIVAVCFYMVIDRQPPYEYLYGEIIPPEPKSGDQIAIHWHLKVNRFCPGWVQRTLTDQRGYYWPNKGTPVRENKQQLEHIVNFLELPRALKAGPVTYHSHACYVCNPLQRFIPFCVDAPELKFTVVPGPDRD